MFISDVYKQHKNSCITLNKLSTKCSDVVMLNDKSSVFPKLTRECSGVYKDKLGHLDNGNIGWLWRDSMTKCHTK